jgi:competence protein ComGB
MDIFPKRITNKRNKNLPADVQLRFLKLLHRLLTNGYPLLSALESIQWDKQMIGPATQIITGLKDGLPIDKAFDKACFHHSITSYLFFVKANGDLQGSIEKCIEMYEQRMNYTKRFQQIMRYPLILLFIFSVLLYFIKKSVLPSFVDLFQTSTEASATVAFSMKIIEILGNLAIMVIIFVIVGLFVWYITKQRVPIEKQIKIYNKVPIFRTFLKLQTSFFFATHFSNLLRTGMSFKEILKHMTQQQKLPIIAHYSTLMTTELTRGLHITSLISQFAFLERQLTTIFRKNVDMQALEKDLTVYAGILMEEIERKIIKAITFIQPMFFIILASFIIFIYITLMWPMFQLIKTI